MSIDRQFKPASVLDAPSATATPSLAPSGGQSNSMLLDLMRDQSQQSPVTPAPFRIGEGKFGNSVGTKAGISKGKTGRG